MEVLVWTIFSQIERVEEWEDSGFVEAVLILEEELWEQWESKSAKGYYPKRSFDFAKSYFNIFQDYT